tara:strand:- start:1094 stop:3535 length:2442 start_codon:yes stop_codon:yes gene_type:complete
MPFSSGTFTRTFDCTTDRDNGVKILASKFDTEFDGIATGLSTCILKDGTQTCTAAIPFAQGITLPDNKTIVLGTNSDITIQYDETTNDSLEIAANVEGAALGVVLKADQGDDNADQHKLNIADGGVLTLGSKISGSFVSYLTHTPNATVADSTTAVAGNLTVGGDLTLGSGAVITEAELEAIDGVTAGTVAASKAVIVDSNKDIASFRNVTLTGELDAGSLDISGDADIDGTLEADAMTLNGTAITATATLDTGISNNNVPKFTSGVADNDFLRVDGTAIEGRSASEVLSDIGAQATLTFGISNTNAVKIDSSSVADDEYARFTANGLESRATSEVLSDIGASPAAGSSNIVTTGALDSGSITSGFGTIDTGSSNITTTGLGTFGSVNIDGGAIDGVTIGTNSAVTDLRVDNLKLDGNTISSTDSNGAITIDPNGTGNVALGNFTFDADQSVGSGQDNYVLKYDNSAGTIQLEAESSGGISEVVDDTSPQLGGNLDLNSNNITGTGNISTTGSATFTTADNNAQLTLTSTDTDANSGPRLDFIRNPGQAGADNDFLSAILHRGYNDAGTPELITYAEANVQIIDASDGSEDARFYINTMVAGSGRSRLNILPSETVFNDDSVDVDFRVESNANANMFFLDANGEHISFGTTNGTVAQSNIAGGFSYKPAAQLEVSGNGTQAAFFNRTDTGNLIGFMTGSSSVGAISVTGSGTTYHTTSDRRLKENIEPLVATDKLMAMNPVSYTWKAFPDEPRSMGFIAQEMAEVMPEAVSTNEHNDMMSMDYGRITPILVSALQDAHRKIEQLEQRIADMES